MNILGSLNKYIYWLECKFEKVQARKNVKSNNIPNLKVCLNFLLDFFFRIRNTVNLRTTHRAVRGMKSFEIHQMAIIDQIAQTPSLQEIVTDHISLRTPIYRKYVKRREKIETTKCHVISTQVALIFVYYFLNICPHIPFL